MLASKVPAEVWRARRGRGGVVIVEGGVVVDVEARARGRVVARRASTVWRTGVVCIFWVWVKLVMGLEMRSLVGG